MRKPTALPGADSRPDRRHDRSSHAEPVVDRAADEALADAAANQSAESAVPSHSSAADASESEKPAKRLGDSLIWPPPEEELNGWEIVQLQSTGHTFIEPLRPAPPDPTPLTSPRTGPHTPIPAPAPPPAPRLYSTIPTPPAALPPPRDRHVGDGILPIESALPPEVPSASAQGLAPPLPSVAADGSRREPAGDRSHRAALGRAASDRAAAPDSRQWSARCASVHKRGASGDRQGRRDAAAHECLGARPDAATDHRDAAATRRLAADQRAVAARRYGRPCRADAHHAHPAGAGQVAYSGVDGGNVARGRSRRRAPLRARTKRPSCSARSTRRERSIHVDPGRRATIPGDRASRVPPAQPPDRRDSNSHELAQRPTDRSVTSSRRHVALPFVERSHTRFRKTSG